MALPSYMSLVDAVYFDQWGFTKQGFMFHLCPLSNEAERAQWSHINSGLDEPINCTRCSAEMPKKTFKLLSNKNKILWTGWKKTRSHY